MSFFFPYLCLLFVSITAANDWNKPCLSGVCEYDLPSINGRSSGTLTIWGPSSSIGDITPAAGWAILDCSPEALEQTIRIACMNQGSSDCAHLFGNTSNLNDAVGKVVRLPETCGRNAFGFVTKATLHEDQSIPVSMVSTLTRRDGTLPNVHSLHISTNASHWGSVGQKVHFSIRAANIPIPERDSGMQNRGLPTVIDDIKSVNDFNKDGSVTLRPLDVNQNFTVVDQSISCPTFRGGVSIHVDTKSHAIMTLGVAASGTIVPPKVDSISLTSSIIANIDAIVGVKANVGGTLDVGEIKLYEAYLPVLDFPGILSIGPSFKIVARAMAILDGEVDMKIGINYNINQPSFTFPQQHRPEGGSVIPGDTPLKINSTQNVNGTGTVSVHLIPSFDFGINSLGEGVNIFVNVDSSVSASLGVKSTEQSKQLPRDVSANDPSIVAHDDSPPPASLDGCFEADSRLSVNVGADADFFSLFNASTQIPLYTQTFQLFKV